MITVMIRENIIRMQGHAGCSINGQDIVCSAISALTCTLIMGLQELTDNRIRADTGSGTTIIEWQKLSDKGKILIDTWFLGICRINEQYNCITFV
ncbi:MAG: ribosomal-processing cysteine protease Prp [Blautia sp.]|nr:ribosomal-processing cysteine protease Prp [Blautia sp.]